MRLDKLVKRWRCLETLVEYRCLLEDNLCGINIITLAPDDLTRAMERALIIQSTS